MINNQFYDELGTGWIDRFDHPVALLRKENEVRAPWVAAEIKTRIGSSVKILDIGCGAGFLTNYLAGLGHSVTGIDISSASLEVAKQMDATKTVKYHVAHAYSLPFPSNSFDAVSAMDVLEHLEEPKLLIAEATRVLKIGGLFFFHTFNRNFFSYLTAVKGIGWLVKNTPRNLHAYPLFIKPEELEEMFEHYKLKSIHWIGLQPKLFSLPMLKMAFTRNVPPDFSFHFTRSLRTGYCGIAQKHAYYF